VVVNLNSTKDSRTKVEVDTKDKIKCTGKSRVVIREMLLRECHKDLASTLLKV